MPAMAALNNEANIPEATALNPNRATSSRRPGAIEPKPPNNIAIELKFANPHNAKLTTITVFGDNDAISGAKEE